MSHSKSRILLMALATVLCCLALIVGATYALFTDRVSVTNHLQAGTLKLTLVREKLTSHNLDPEGSGYMKNEEDEDEMDFTDPTDKNIFGLSESVLIVPTSTFTADMRIEHGTDSNVAFGYWIEIVLNTDDSDAELAEQLKVTVTYGDNEEAVKYLNQGLTIGSDAAPIETIGVGETAEFSVTLEFVNLDNATNNLAQGQNVYFDLIVHAVQSTQTVS